MSVVKYEDYWLKQDRTGYRRVAQATEVTEVSEGLFLPSEVTTSTYSYYADEETAWCWTTVMSVLDIRAHEEEAAVGPEPWDWLPLAVFCTDPEHLIPGNDSHDPYWHVGDVHRALSHAARKHPEVPPVVAAWDRPIDDEAWTAHQAPARDAVSLPPVRPAREPADGAQP